MVVNKVLRILNSFFQPGDQLLTYTIVIEIFDTIDKVSVLCEMQVFLRFALLTHFSVVADLYGADKGQWLIMF